MSSAVSSVARVMLTHPSGRPLTSVREGLGVSHASSPRFMKSLGVGGVRGEEADKNAWARSWVVKASISSLERAFCAAESPWLLGPIPMGGGERKVFGEPAVSEKKLIPKGMAPRCIEWYRSALASTTTQNRPRGPPTIWAEARWIRRFGGLSVCSHCLSS